MKQFIKFGIVGASNTIISYIIYLLSLSLFQKFDLFSEFDYIISSIIAFFLSVLWSYYWNSRFTFADRKRKKSGLSGIVREIIKSYVGYASTGLVLSNALLYFIVEIINQSKRTAPLICLVFTVPINFFLNRFWVFSDKKE